MRLTRFSSNKVHGFLDFDVSFHDRLTFLTGINGSGKTTVLNAIVAIISPDLAALQALDFKELKIDFVDDAGKKSWIRAVRKTDAISLGVSGAKEAFVFSPFVPEPSMPAHRQSEAEAEHFRELVAMSAAHPVMKFIGALPTPMFLGLDRRARVPTEDRRLTTTYRYRVASRNVFGGSLATGVSEAEELAEMAYRDARFRASRIGEELQRQMLLNLLTFTREDYLGISLPTEQEKRDLRRVRSDLPSLPSIFHLPKSEVDKRIRPFVEQLEKALENIPKDINLDDVFAGRESPGYFGDLMMWSANKSQLKRIKVISQTVAQYNERRSEALRQFETYKGLVNGFLSDSDKTIEVSEHGHIYVKIRDIDSQRPLSSLSSGEAQIFVILTNLAFNPAAQKANVFIIDEPELSLHVRWQEKFVDAMLSSNEKIQFIMATHSPSIILERLEACVEVSGKTKRSR